MPREEKGLLLNLESCVLAPMTYQTTELGVSQVSGCSRAMITPRVSPCAPDLPSVPTRWGPAVPSRHLLLLLSY